MILLKNAHIHTMEKIDGKTEFQGKFYEIANGYILIDKEKILEVGEGDKPSIELSDETNLEIIDCDGGHITPGLIDGHCHLGLHNEGLRWEGQDFNEGAAPTTPGLRAIDSIFTQDKAFAQAVQAGVTTVMTGPGSANVCGGQFALISTAGRTINEILLKSPVALKCAFGENPKGFYGQARKVSPYTRMGVAYLLRELLYRGQEYLAERNEFSRRGDKEKFKFNLDLDPVADVLQGKMPLKVHAHRADDILTAIRICEEFHVKYTLDHCTEGMYIVDALVEAYKSKAAQLQGIFLGPLFCSQSKPELSRSNGGVNVKTLYDAGLPIAVITDHPVVKLDLLSVFTALTCRYGMEKNAALATITVNPARIIGIDDSRGMISAGKIADLAVFSAHPFAFDSVCKYTFVNGKKVWSV